MAMLNAPVSALEAVNGMACEYRQTLPSSTATGDPKEDAVSMSMSLLFFLMGCEGRGECNGKPNGTYCSCKHINELSQKRYCRNKGPGLQPTGTCSCAGDGCKPNCHRASAVDVENPTREGPMGE